MTVNGRPLETTADCLRAVGELLEMGERALAFKADTCGLPRPTPVPAATELVMVIAEWLDLHREVDDQLLAVLDAVASAL